MVGVLSLTIVTPDNREEELLTLWNVHRHDITGDWIDDNFTAVHRVPPEAIVRLRFTEEGSAYINTTT